VHNLIHVDLIKFYSSTVYILTLFCFASGEIYLKEKLAVFID